MVDTFVAFDDATRVREEVKHFDSFVFFGKRTQNGGGPQMYMNLVDPGTELVAHFHRVDQFQVFFGTPDSVFQRKPIPPLFVHYTDAFSTYGPFRSAADQPLLYATIRAESSNYGGIMPTARRERLWRGERQLSSAVEDWEPHALPAAGIVERAAVFEREADGLAAELIRLGPLAETLVARVGPVSGTALCVVAGGLRPDGDGHLLGPRALGWHGPDQPPLKLTAGPEGCAVLVLDFPYPATQSTPPPRPSSSDQ